MTLFSRAVSTSSYLKAGFMGSQGSGKTTTATLLAIGIAKLINERKLKEAGRPIFFIDSETGSDYVAGKVRDAGFELFTAKTRAFVDLLDGVDEAEANGCVLLIDSITHFWREFCEAYKRKRNRTRLEFQDWANLKEQWGAFTDRYVNSQLHILMCGRMGYEYEHETDEDGKRELVKADVKMKAEGETGYEPSLLVLMERMTDTSRSTTGTAKKKKKDAKANRVVRVANVLKDRFDVIDGLSFKNPTFEDFAPHIKLLNLGHTQLGVDTSRKSDELFGETGDTRWAWERKQKTIALEEIEAELVKMYPGQSAADKKAKADIVEELFDTRSWTAVEGKSLDELKMGRNALWLKSRGHAYGVAPPEKFDDEIPHDPPKPALAAA